MLCSLLKRLLGRKRLTRLLPACMTPDELISYWKANVELPASGWHSVYLRRLRELSELDRDYVIANLCMYQMGFEDHMTIDEVRSIHNVG